MADRRVLTLLCFSLCVVEIGATACPDCTFYMLAVNLDGTGTQRGTETEGQIIGFHSFFRALNFNIIIGAEACATYAHLVCGENSVCTPGSSESVYYHCACVAGNYIETRGNQEFTCTEGPTHAAVTVPTTTANVPTTADAIGSTSTISTADVKIAIRRGGEFLQDQTKPQQNVAELETDCCLRQSGRCYCIRVEQDKINFPRAKMICKERNQSLANITNEEIYNAIMEDTRGKIPPGYLSISLWTGMTTDNLFSNDTKLFPDEYTKWHPGQPQREHSSWNKIFLVIDKDSASPYQGMMNGFALSTLQGVICQMPL